MTARDRSGAASPKVLVAIAQALDGAEAPRARIGRALELLGSLVPYEHCALLRVQGGVETELVIRPEPPPPRRVALSARVREVTRLLGAGDEEPSGDAGPAAPADHPHLAVPLVGLDELAGVLYVEGATGDEYGDQCVTTLSIVAAQLGSYLTIQRLVEQQAEASRQLARAQETQQRLIGVVGHDLRNPLTVIHASASLLLRRGADEVAARGLGRIVGSARRADGIIEALLDTTRARLGGGIPIERAAVDLDALVADAVDEARVANPGRAIRHESSGPLRGSGDGGRLAQVISNLLGNALRHGDPASPVSVTTRSVPGGAELVVHNLGPAIPGEVLPHIFDPFRQGGGASGVRRAGLGLGLYIVHDIVRGHGGRVEARSSEEAGTAFTVFLPEMGAADPASGRQAAGATPGPETILVVDDDPDIRAALADVLADEGYPVASAADGAEALRLLRSRQPGLVLLDLMMPVKDGFEVLAEMKADPRLASIPVIVVTAGQARPPEQASAFLRKPVDIDALLASVARHRGRAA